MCSIFRLIPIVRCGRATWPQHLTYLLFPALRVDVKVTLLGRGRSIVASALFPGDKVLSLETSFSCCWVYLKSVLTGWLTSRRAMTAMDLSLNQVSEVVKRYWLASTKNSWCVLGKSRGQVTSMRGFGFGWLGFFFFLFFLNNLSFSQCYQEGLYWPLPLIPSPAEYCVPLLK